MNKIDDFLQGRKENRWERLHWNQHTIDFLPEMKMDNLNERRERRIKKSPFVLTYCCVGVKNKISHFT